MTGNTRSSLALEFLDLPIVSHSFILLDIDGRLSQLLPTSHTLIPLYPGVEQE